MSLVILLGVIIPVALIFVVIKAGRSHTLHRIDLEKSLGILYNEYQGKFYYWETCTIITVNFWDDNNYFLI